MELHRGNQFLQIDIRSSWIHFQLGSSAKTFKVLGFEAILFTFTCMKLSLKLLLKLSFFFEYGKKVAGVWKINALLVCICGLNSHLKYSFKGILEKKHEIFFYGALLTILAHEVFIEVLPFQENCSALCAFNSHPNFSSYFHPNIYVRTNIPIYRKLIQDNISLLFEDQKSIVQYYFERDVKLLVHIYLQ